MHEMGIADAMVKTIDRIVKQEQAAAEASGSGADQEAAGQ